MRVSDRVRMVLITGAAGALLVGTVAQGQEAEPVASQLTPRLRELLQQEMQAILLASHEILDALVMGDHAVVADRAQRIRGSFIMEQSLTERDKVDLMAAVPPDLPVWTGTLGADQFVCECRAWATMVFVVLAAPGAT